MYFNSFLPNAYILKIKKKESVCESYKYGSPAYTHFGGRM